MLAYKIKRSSIKNNIFIPKYYDPDLYQSLKNLNDSHDLLQIGELIDSSAITVQTGHEIGKMAYGTGNIPFVRTSDISNWEIKAVPKQGISEELFQLYKEKEDVHPGDILMVRDGSYLIGTNCIISPLDIPMVFQSHILKFRILDENKIHPFLFFLVLNCSLVQRQIRNLQFTADIIDTLGSRYREIILPIPRDNSIKKELIDNFSVAFDTRIKFKAAIKQMPLLIEKVLETNSIKPIDDFFGKSVDELLSEIVQDTTTLEFGDFSFFTVKHSQIKDGIFLPKYYDPSIKETLESLSSNCFLISIQELMTKGTILLSTGDEIGKQAYGTGDIPFIRTSDFSNWEIKADPKQGISEEIYLQYAEKEDVQKGDILLVRDGSYLIGTSCMVMESDSKMLYCGGLIKIRVNHNDMIDNYLLLGLLNSYIVKRQIRTKQFTRDVIDTIGQRLKEVVIPIPKSPKLREAISNVVNLVVNSRIQARDTIQALAEKVI